VITKYPSRLKGAAKLTYEILTSENYRPSETCIREWT